MLNIKKIYDKFASISNTRMIRKLYENDTLHGAFEKIADLKPLINSEYDDVLTAIKAAIEADNATDAGMIDHNLTPKMNLA